MFTQAIALNRFGLGARRDDAPPAAPQHWLLDSMAGHEVRPPALAAIQSSTVLASTFREARRRLHEQRRMGSPLVQAENQASRFAREAYAEHVQARVVAAVDSRSPFTERLVHFWANHFAVSADNPKVRALAGTLEFEAIRPRVLGRFADMLLAAERHPAMLLYLDQANSVGPNSRTGLAARARQSKRLVGLNENLAREILELHTLGVAGGYGQADVLELARALTGWTVAGFGQEGGEIGRFSYQPDLHEPGERMLLGRRYAAGETQAEMILRHLAAHPATARHVATKLVRHFVSDDPPPAAVARLARAFEEAGGELTAVYRALVESPEAWSAPLPKLKSPWEWLVSAMRALSLAPDSVDAVRLLNDLGQPAWRPRSPAGWADAARAWASPDALLRRVRLAETFAKKAGNLDPRELAPRLFPGVLSPRTASAVEAAETARQGLALLLCAPEFQRR